MASVWSGSCMCRTSCLIVVDVLLAMWSGLSVSRIASLCVFVGSTMYLVFGVCSLVLGVFNIFSNFCLIHLYEVSRVLEVCECVFYVCYFAFYVFITANAMCAQQETDDHTSLNSVVVVGKIVY